MLISRQDCIKSETCTNCAYMSRDKKWTLSISEFSNISISFCDSIKVVKRNIRRIRKTRRILFFYSWYNNAPDLCICNNVTTLINNLYLNFNVLLSSYFIFWSRIAPRGDSEAQQQTHNSHRMFLKHIRYICDKISKVRCYYSSHDRCSKSSRSLCRLAAFLFSFKCFKPIKLTSIFSIFVIILSS